MFGLTPLDPRLSRLESRVRHQQQVINRLCELAGIDPAEADPTGHVDAVERQLIADGKLVQAIKHHRDRTGSGLGEAKDIIDNAARDAREQ